MLATVSAARKTGRLSNLQRPQSCWDCSRVEDRTCGSGSLNLGPSQRTSYPEGGQTGLSRGRAIPRDPTTTPAFWIWWPSGFGGLLGMPDQSHRKEAPCAFPLGPVVWVMGLRPLWDLGLGYRCQPPQAAQETRRPVTSSGGRRASGGCAARKTVHPGICAPSLRPPSRTSDCP